MGDRTGTDSRDGQTGAGEHHLVNREVAGNATGNGGLPPKYRNALLPLYAALFAVIFSGSLIDLATYAFHPDHSRYNAHVVLIPFVSGYLLHLKRERIRESGRFSVPGGVPVILAGLLLHWAGGSMGVFRLTETDALSLATFAVVVCWIGGFLLLFGTRSFRIALFPLLFLLFMIPMPTFFMKKALQVLQAAANEVSAGLFGLTGIPMVRDGFVISLPGVSIEIAEQCSGLRASLTLLIIGFLAAHLFLRRAWCKGTLILSAIPITILGNALRIVGLTLLALYVDIGYLDSRSAPHYRGGLAFFLVDLLVLAGVAALLMRREKNGDRMVIRSLLPR